MRGAGGMRGNATYRPEKEGAITPGPPHTSGHRQSRSHDTSPCHTCRLWPGKGEQKKACDLRASSQRLASQAACLTERTDRKAGRPTTRCPPSWPIPEGFHRQPRPMIRPLPGLGAPKARLGPVWPAPPRGEQQHAKLIAFALSLIWRKRNRHRPRSRAIPIQ